MTRTVVRRTTVAAAVLFFLSGGAGWLTQDAWDDRPECQIVEAWVRAHAQELPLTLDEFNEIPHSFRQVVFGVLPAHVRSSIMQAHLGRLIEMQRVTPEQAAVLHAVIPLMSADFYQGMEDASRRALAEAGPPPHPDPVTYDPNDPWVQQLEQIERLEATVFTRRELRMLALHDEPLRRPSSLTTPRLRLGEWLRGVVRADTSWCNCSRIESNETCEATDCTGSQKQLFQCLQQGVISC